METNCRRHTRQYLSGCADVGIALERMQLSPSSGWIAINAMVEVAEELLKVEDQVWMHASGVEQIGSTSMWFRRLL